MVKDKKFFVAWARHGNAEWREYHRHAVSEKGVRRLIKLAYNKDLNRVPGAFVEVDGIREENKNPVLGLGRGFLISDAGFF